jgi:hypothetical protein
MDALEGGWAARWMVSGCYKWIGMHVDGCMIGRMDECDTMCKQQNPTRLLCIPALHFDSLPPVIFHRSESPTLALQLNINPYYDRFREVIKWLVG